jgi:hypothetical protein
MWKCGREELQFTNQVANARLRAAFRQLEEVGISFQSRQKMCPSSSDDLIATIEELGRCAVNRACASIATACTEASCNLRRSRRLDDQTHAHAQPSQHVDQRISTEEVDATVQEIADPNLCCGAFPERLDEVRLESGSLSGGVSAT